MSAESKQRFTKLGTISCPVDSGPTLYASAWTDGESVIELIYLRSRRVLSVHVEAVPPSYGDASNPNRSGLWAAQAMEGALKKSPERNALSRGRALWGELLWTAEHLDDLADVSISPAFIRDLRIGELLNSELEEQATMDRASTGIPPKQIVIVNTRTATAVGFDTVKQLNARLRMVNASAVYASVTERGVNKPMVNVAESLDCSESAARALITRARREGYLTPGQRGKPGGQLTDKAKQLIEAVSGNAGS